MQNLGKAGMQDQAEQKMWSETNMVNMKVSIRHVPQSYRAFLPSFNLQYRSITR